MLHRPILAAALVLAAALAACGGGGDRPVPRTACNYGTHCHEYEGYTLDVSSTNAGCTLDGATAMTACPAAGVLGVCTGVRDVITIRSFYYDPSTVGGARDLCIALGDTWTTP